MAEILIECQENSLKFIDLMFQNFIPNMGKVKILLASINRSCMRLT